MKLALFAFLIALSASAQTAPPTGRLGPDFLKGLEVDPATEKRLRDEALAAQAARDRQRADIAAQAREAARVARLAQQAAQEEPVRLAMRAQKAVTAQPATKSDCPGYRVFDFSQAAPAYASEKFSGPGGQGNPIVTYADYRPIVPNATHEIRPTIVVQAGSGWDAKEVTDALAKVAQMYGQCGIRLGRVSVVQATLPYGISVINENNERYTAHHMPEGAPKPWLFFVNHRADNPSQDGGGKSMAYTSDSSHDNVIKGTAWMARDSLTSSNGKRNGYTPELIVGHELAHLMTDGGHQTGERRPDGTNDPKNILADDGHDITGKITARECAQMKANTSLIHKL